MGLDKEVDRKEGARRRILEKIQSGGPGVYEILLREGHIFGVDETGSIFRAYCSASALELPRERRIFTARCESEKCLGRMAMNLQIGGAKIVIPYTAVEELNKADSLPWREKYKQAA